MVMIVWLDRQGASSLSQEDQGQDIERSCSVQESNLQNICYVNVFIVTTFGLWNYAFKYIKLWSDSGILI